MPYRHARNTVSGQLKLPTTGSSGGIVIGGDVALYRGGTNLLDIPDSLRIAFTIYVDEWIEHTDDSDTYIRFQTNNIYMSAGNLCGYRANATGLRFYDGGTPVAQPVHLADPTDLATCITAITQLIDNQKALGLMAADP